MALSSPTSPTTTSLLCTAGDELYGVRPRLFSRVSGSVCSASPTRISTASARPAAAMCARTRPAFSGTNSVPITMPPPLARTRPPARSSIPPATYRIPASAPLFRQPNDCVVYRHRHLLPSSRCGLVETMSSIGILTCRVTAATMVGSALLTAGSSPAAAAPPASDGQGYVDSTARCSSPEATVVFGSTATSRVAICATSAGHYEYRGVRVRDGARMIASASQTADGGYTARSNDGTAYTVSATSLAVQPGQRVVREEPMVDFHASQKPTVLPAAPSAAAPPESPPTPMPPPLPAEVGGNGN